MRTKIAISTTQKTNFISFYSLVDSYFCAVTEITPQVQFDIQKFIFYGPLGKSPCSKTVSGVISDIHFMLSKSARA